MNQSGRSLSSLPQDVSHSDNALTKRNWAALVWRFLILPLSLVACGILGWSHAVDLRTDFIIYRYPDPVFPFLTARSSYTVFTFLLAIQTLSIATQLIQGISNPRRIALGSALLSGAIVFYRGALVFLEVHECRCLGVLGKLLELTKEQELNFRIGFFTAIALPALFFAVAFVARRHFRQLGPLLLMVATMVGFSLNAAPSVWVISGEVTTQVHNPKTGAKYPGTGFTGPFVAHIGSAGYRIRANNPLDGSFFEINRDVDSLVLLQFVPQPGTAEGKANSAYTCVDSGNWFLGAGLNNLHAYFLWLAFGLDRGTYERQPVAQRPLPWGQPRFTPEPYGYAWDASFGADGRFLDKATAIRDYALDFTTDREEYLRPQLDFPTDTDSKRRYKIMLNDIRRMVPDKLLAGEYHSGGWITNQSGIFPGSGELKYFLHDGFTVHGTNYPHPVFVGSFSVKSVFETNALPLASLSTPNGTQIRVQDYRFKQIRGERLYPFAPYSVPSGGTIRSLTDSSIIAEREHVLTTGPILSWSDTTPKHQLLLGSLATCVLGFVTWWQLSGRKNK